MKNTIYINTIYGRTQLKCYIWGKTKTFLSKWFHHYNEDATNLFLQQVLIEVKSATNHLRLLLYWGGEEEIEWKSVQEYWPIFFFGKADHYMHDVPHPMFWLPHSVFCNCRQSFFLTTPRLLSQRHWLESFPPKGWLHSHNEGMSTAWSANDPACITT